MDHAIYTAMGAARQTLEQQSITANNLANASTPGFRAQLAADDNEISQILELRLQGFSKAEIRKQLLWPPTSRQSSGQRHAMSVRASSPCSRSATSCPR